MKKYFEAASYLNERLCIATDNFDITGLPIVKAIFCAGETFSISFAEVLQKTHEKEHGTKPEIITQKTFRVLTINDASDFVAKEVRIAMVDKGLKFDEIIVICNNYHASSHHFAAKDFLPYCAAVEAYREYLLNKKSFIKKGGAGLEIVVKPKNVDVIVTFYDDMTVVLDADELLIWIAREHGRYGPSGKERRIICAGGMGIMSKILFKSFFEKNERISEGELQKKVWKMLGCREVFLHVADKGTNTGLVLKQLAEMIEPHEVATIVVTNRLSLALQASQRQQQLQLNLSYLVVWEDVEQSCKFYNGMAFCNNKPILHWWAHLLQRWEAYSTKSEPFMTPVYGVSQEIRVCANLLQPKFVAKQVDKYPIKSKWQALPLMWAVFFNKEKARENIKTAISMYNAYLRSKYND